MNKIREKKPQRTCTKKYKNYRSYKEYLRDDFNSKCGYCDTTDHWLGGKKVFHVDHFAPFKPFSHLQTEYSNLVYSCPTCNIAKSNKWVSNSDKINIKNYKGFIDPCEDEYDIHLGRDKNGKIICYSSIGEYMVNNLNLSLPKHSLIWTLEKLEKLIENIDTKLDDENLDKNGRIPLLEASNFYNRLYAKHRNILRNKLDE